MTEITQKNHDLILGIDLGTTHSLVAVCDEKGPVILKDGESSLIPSAVYFNEAGQIQAVGGRAKTLKSVAPEHIVYSMKRMMGKGKADIPKLDLPFDLSSSTPEIVKVKMGGRLYTPIELSAAILARCKFVAENALGMPVKKAVITVPAYFDDGQRAATAMAGKLAGLEVVRLLNEPTAAALAFGFGIKDRADQQFIAIYDFGGGTFDISILKVSGNIFEVVATHGDTHLGGDDLDQAIAAFLTKRAGKVPKSESDKILLLTQAEKIKMKLGESESVDVVLQWDGQIQWSGAVTRAEINEVMQSVIARTLHSCAEALKIADLKSTVLDAVILVGGSTRVPLVREMVQKFFGKKPNSSVNPDEVVALGAAIQASILSGEVKDALLLDVVPLSLGIETMGGLVNKMIVRNSTIPASAREMFTTYADNQTGVDIHVVQGEREFVGDCRSLAKFKLRMKPAPAGIPKIQVDFFMDASGMLHVKARDQKTGEAAGLEVRPSFGLTDAEVEKMLQEAWDSAAEDFSKRQLVEAKNQARALIYATEKSLQNPILSADFRKTQEALILPILKALRVDLDAATLDVILLRTKELDHVTQELAQAILNKSVQDSLAHQPIESVRV